MSLLTKKKYSFISKGMDKETFTVVSFKGFEAISKPYKFEILLVSEKADIAVLKVGERGSYISHAGNIIKVDPTGEGAVVDTTGAGDLWASGFLFGLVNDYPLEKCGRLGSLCGYEVCRVVGASIPDEGWQRIKGEVTNNK